MDVYFPEFIEASIQIKQVANCEHGPNVHALTKTAIRRQNFIDC